jgi:hypothetical protein
MPTDVSHRQSVDAEPVVLSVVATEAVVRYPIAVVAAALLPGAMLGLPAVSAIALPRNLLLTHVRWSALLGGPVVPLLAASLLLILLRSGLLLLLSCRVVLFVLPRLPLIILLLPGYLLLLLIGTVLLLLSLCFFPALGLLLLALLRLFIGIILLLLSLRVLPSFGSLLLLVLLVRCLFLIVSSRTSPLFLGFNRILLFLPLFLLLWLVLFILVRKNWNGPAKKQKYQRCIYDSN